MRGGPGPQHFYGMGRLRRVVVPGVAHHVTQRGNNRRQVFFCDADYLCYLDILKRHSTAFGLSILAYCLMPNHVHLIAEPETAAALSTTLQRTQAEYALYRNRRSEATGHLWQARFHSCALSQMHLWPALRYVERNPSRAGLVGNSVDWPWSSARAHCGATDSALLDLRRWAALQTGTDWPEMLETEEARLVEAIRRGSRTGRPPGSTEFLEVVEHATGRRLRRLPRTLALAA